MTSAIQSLRLVGRYGFFDEPPPLTLQDYERAVVDFTREISRLSGVRAIYQTGSVSLPGASDLDMIVVVHDKDSASPMLWPAMHAVRARHAYLFLHDPVVATPRELQAINKFAFIGQPRLLFGEPSEVQDVAGIYRISWLVDHFNDNFPSDVFRGAQLSFRRRIANDLRSLALPPSIASHAPLRMSVRFALCKLNGIIHDLRNLEIGSGTKIPPLREYCDRIAELRAGWFPAEEAQFHQLASLLDELPRWCGVILYEVARYFRKEWFEFRNPWPYLPNRFHQFRVNLYLNDFRADDAARLLAHHLFSLRLRTHVLPAALAVHEVLRHGAPVDTSSRARFEEYRAVVQERDDLVARLRSLTPSFHGGRGLGSCLYFGLTEPAWRIRYALALGDSRVLLARSPTRTA